MVRECSQKKWKRYITGKRNTNQYRKANYEYFPNLFLSQWKDGEVFRSFVSKRTEQNMALASAVVLLIRATRGRQPRRLALPAAPRQLSLWLGSKPHMTDLRVPNISNDRNSPRGVNKASAFLD